MIRNVAPALAFAVLLAAGPVAAQAPAPSRGELLYATHCIGCHTAQMHWRDQRAATDWDSLMAQVRRWQAAIGLGWDDADVQAVARLLNERIYRYPAPAAPQAGLAPGR